MSIHDLIRQHCTADSPMPDGAPGRWRHVDARETDYDGDNCIEYHCPNCGHTFKVEMPD